MGKAIFNGSFDPFTLGHLGIVFNAYENYDAFIINIGNNSEKVPLFTVDERLKMIEETLREYGVFNRVELIANDGLTVDIALKEKAFVLIRGIHENSNDWQEEKTLADINELLGKVRGIDLKTDFIVKDSIISSSRVKKLCQLGEFIVAQSCVSSFVHQKLMEKFLQPYLRHSLVFEREDKRGVFYANIIEAYQNRAYHNLSHIGYMLNMLQIYQHYKTGKKDLTNLDSLIFAIFMHDYVYNALGVDNEEKSVEAFNKIEGAYFHSISNREKIVDLILATKHDKSARNEDEALIADLDLSILGTSSEALWRWYCHSIRKEYDSVPTEDYRSGRIAILEKFLQRTRIFQTEFFYDMQEKQARKNILSEIERLKTVPLL